MIISVFSVFILTMPQRWLALLFAKQLRKLIRQQDPRTPQAVRQLVGYQSDFGLVVSSLVALQASLT